MSPEQIVAIVLGSILLLGITFVAGYNIGRLVEKVDWYENHRCRSENDDYETDPSDDPDDGERAGLGGFPRSIMVDAENEKNRSAA